MEYMFVPMKCYCVFILITFVVVVNAGVLRPKADDSKQKIGIVGLYNSTDKVKILSNDNFQNELLDKNHSTLVQFYNSYCGHCRKFAPVYKRLAEHLYDWRDILQISAINCAADENNDICREYEIMGYPTLRYFGPGFLPLENNYGKAIDSQNLNEITDSLIQFIISENKTANMSDWPDFQALHSFNVTSLFEDLDILKKLVVLVYEPASSTVGVETILNFVRYPQIAVKRITDTAVGAKYQIYGTEYKIATVNRQGSVAHYISQNETSASYKETIKSFLTAEHITEKPETKHEDITTVQNPTEAPNLLKIIEEVKHNKHLVYQADLEMAIRHILFNEIPKAPYIKSDKLVALKEFLKVLVRYNPLGATGRMLISELSAFVARHKEELLGKDFETELKNLENKFGNIFSYSQFVGCIGSQSGLRGFTCSLWQLFHYMTVQATYFNDTSNALEVLTAMHGYVQFFFGCTECSDHFLAMAATRKIFDTKTKDDAVLWVWAAHNEVNKRLAGDATEDPKFPKIQFPSENSCAECYVKNDPGLTDNPEDKWNKTNVLKFLKHIHNAMNISLYGLKSEEPIALEKLRQKRMISSVFSDMDMRVALFLYGFCIAMLVVAFKLFALRRSYRKKAVWP